MKKVIFGVMAALALVSCSKEEVVEMNRTNDEITFGVVANKPTKAADVYCNNNMPESFKVWALYDGLTYIDGDNIVKDGTSWVNTSGTRYWPNTGNVTFLALANGYENFALGDYTSTLSQYEVPTNVAAQKDLIYAVTSKAKSENPVILNFRHALSQIVFSAKNTNANLYVEIEGVKICNLANKNSFMISHATSTDGNYEDHSGNIGTFAGNGNNWVVGVTGTTTYPVAFDAVAVNGDNNVVSLTSANEAGKEFNNNAMLLLPQTNAAWDINAAPAPADATGSYFLVNCLIYNVAGTTVDKTTDVCLWGTENAGTYEAKELAIPVDIAWEQGKKYIYTFVFGNGNGGYDPVPDDPSTPEPALVPITFDVTVDDFVVVSNTEIKSGF